MKLTFFIWMCYLCSVIYSSRILILPLQGKSHMISTNAIGHELKKNGHDVRISKCDYEV